MLQTLIACGLCLFAAGTALLAQQKTEPPPEKRQSPADAGAVPSYILGPEDLLQIWVRDGDEIGSKPYRIDHAGMINLPFLGRVQAAGWTVQDLEFDLKLRLRKYFREPELTVTVTEFRSAPVFVFGAVKSPGMLQLLGPRPLLEVISMAGGLEPEAGATLMLTRRLEYGKIPMATAETDGEDQFSTVEIDLRSLIDGRRPEDNLTIRPYDVISVPRSDVIYVSGEVRNPGSIQPTGRSPITVLQAVSSSGGLTITAAAQGARIMRPILGGPKRYEIALDVKSMLSGKAPDYPLQGGDILFIPTATVSTSRVMMRLVESIANAGVHVGLWSILRNR
jgi:polysaccharide export outer membrane protein